MNFNFEKITALMIAVILLVGACAVALSSCKQKGNNADGGTETESDADVSQTSEEEETQPDETESESSEESEEETQTDETEEDTDDTQESDSDTSQDDSFADRIIIAEKENARFSIVIAENIGNNETLRDTVDALVRLIVSTTGAAPEILTPSAEEYDADANQILIGDTGYAESNAVYSEIGYGEWTLRFNGNKFVVAGCSPSAIDTATFTLLQTLKREKKGKTLSLSYDYEVTDTVNELINSLPRYDGAGLPTMYDEGDDTSLAVFSGMELSKYEAYLKTIEKAGYTFYSESSIKDNKFTTYINDDYLIYAGYYAYEKAIRVSIEKKLGLTGRENENLWAKNGSVVSSMAQIQLEGLENGMSYCYQLADGSFIVIDGADNQYAKNLYEYMRAKSPDGDIVIAAWILTHPHADHYLAINTFCETYDDYKIEKIIMNFPGPDIYAQEGQADNRQVQELATRLEGCQLVKAHTGQRFYIRNAVVEILYSLDSLYGYEVVNMNDTSLVFTVEVEGEKATFTGDMNIGAADVLVKMYGDYLKSDFLQLAHHGGRNGFGEAPKTVVNFYRTVSAEVIVVPGGIYSWLTGVCEFGMNKAAMESAREVYVRGDLAIVFELPYTYYSAYHFDPSDPTERVPVASDKPSSGESVGFGGMLEDGDVDKVKW